MITLQRISDAIGMKTYVVLGISLLLSLMYFSSQVPARTEAEKMRGVCRDLHSQYDNVPIAQLTRKQLSLLRACESQGL